MSKDETLDDILSEDEPKIEEQPEEATEEPVEEPQEPQAAAEPEEEPEDKPEPKQEPQMVPLAALQEERSNARELKEQMNALQAQLQTLTQQQQPKQEEPEPFKLPDPLDDPESFNGSLMEFMNQRDMNLRAEMSEAFAVRQHGKEAVDSAFQRAQAAGVVGNFSRSPDPYGALMEWDQQQQEFEPFRKAGGLEGLKKQLRDELMAELNAETVADQIVPSAPSLAGETDLGRRSPLQQKPVQESLKDILGNPHDT